MLQLHLLGFQAFRKFQLMILLIVWQNILHWKFIKDIYQQHVLLLIMMQSELQLILQKKSWQEKWDQDVSGYYTRQLISEVETKVCFPEKRNIGISYCRLLLHDTMLRDDSFRTGTSDIPVCACGLERETAAHF